MASEFFESSKNQSGGFGPPPGAVAVQWRGSEAWQATPRAPIFPDRYKEKPNKYSSAEQNTAQSFEMAVGTQSLGSIYGNGKTITDLAPSTAGGSGGGGGGARPDLLGGVDWAKWAPVAVGGVLIAFLLYRYSKGGK